MPSLSRFGVSLDQDLLRALDRWLRQQGFANRSQAIGELVREALVQEEWRDAGRTVVGTVTLIYDPGHHVLSHTLTKTQHRHHDRVVSSQHIHLDARNCLEVIVLKGPSGEIKRIADRLRALKGVKHGQCIMTTCGRGLD